MTYARNIMNNRHFFFTIPQNKTDEKRTFISEILDYPYGVTCKKTAFKNRDDHTQPNHTVIFLNESMKLQTLFQYFVLSKMSESLELTYYSRPN